MRTGPLFAVAPHLLDIAFAGRLAIGVDPVAVGVLVAIEVGFVGQGDTGQEQHENGNRSHAGRRGV